MCSSRKYPHPPHGWSLEILTGWGMGLKSQNFKRKLKHDAKLGCPEGFKPKNHPLGEWLFSQMTKTSIVCKCEV